MTPRATSIDVICPKCKAKSGEPCVRLIALGGSKGEPLPRVHRQRTGRVPEQPAKCGTYAGAQRHRRLSEPTCDACKAAAAEHMRRYRAKYPANYEHERRVTRARGRALWRLAKDYPARFRQYVEDELENEAS